MSLPIQAAGGRHTTALFARALRRVAPLVFAALAVTVAAGLGHAAPFIWDQDGDHVDDRIESVNLLGYSFAFEDADTLSRMRFDVSRDAGGGLFYGVYVVYTHPVTPTDITALTLLGMAVLHRYENAYGVRSVATFAQAQAVAALSGVERVEAIPLLYPVVREGTASLAVRDPTEEVFPTWQSAGGGDGSGIVVAFLDTGINDAAEGSYPGHESLAGRCLGGAEFFQGDSLGDTPWNGSTNPSDHGGNVTNAHGTHVAGIALGSGGPSGYAIGVAPGARFLDVKVLNDLGIGTGVAEAIDWCIHNRSRDWGAAGYEGIDVVNLSLSSLDATDGEDFASRLANRAVQLGMVVVASVGNEGEDHYIPSPAGAAGVLAVGAIDDQRTGRVTDDQWVSFNDYGPRASDGDLDPTDEQKPDLLAPGISILSADGNLSSDGEAYQRLSGTSMSAAFVSGVVAALRSSYPSLTPVAVAEVLRSTARRDLGGLPVGETGVDPRWRSTVGYGVVDLLAARLELEQPQRSQIDRLELTGAASTVTVVLRTQRERGAGHFVFERAVDASGVPGPFAPYDSVAAAGDSSLAGVDNRQAYTRAWTVPVGERGVTHWYRVSYSEGGVRWNSAARRFVSPVGPAAATIELTVVHNAYDHDVTGQISVGAGEPGPGLRSQGGGISFALPGSGAAASSEWDSGLSATGNVAWNFRIEVPQGAAEAYLPPSITNPWWLRVDDGGYLNRSGRITEYRIVWHSTNGDITYEGGPLPRNTNEGGSVYAAVPQGIVGVDGAPATTLRFGPSPVRAGGTVWFSMPAGAATDLRVYDLAGREVGRVPFGSGAQGLTARWTARDAHGELIPAGVYFARAGRGGLARLVVVR